MIVYNVYRSSKGLFGISQVMKSGYNWDHAHQSGYHETPELAEQWATKHAGSIEHRIDRIF